MMRFRLNFICDSDSETRINDDSWKSLLGDLNCHKFTFAYSICCFLPLVIAL